MKILNKLNGWQRLWLLGAVAAQMYVVTTWSAWFYPSSSRHCIRWIINDERAAGRECIEHRPLQNVLISDISENLGALLICLAVYVAAYVVVKIVRWVISGFKK